MRAVIFLAAVVATAAVTGGQLEAKTIRCPQKDPLFQVTIPDAWSAAFEQDGSMTCMPRNRSKYVSFVPSENVRSKGELKAQLLRTARNAGENAKMKDLKLGEVKEVIRPNGLNLMSIKVQGTSQGKPMVFSLVAFAPKKDNYFTVIALEPAAGQDREISAMINSISSTR